jgi:glycosyltransferase involved in cell wall biosynthesis
VHNARVPRVTVFIPTYNRAPLLPQAIRSVLEQTFDDLRLLVSDNASEDETPEVVASFDDPRIEYVRQPENLGLLGNQNWFLTHVETDFALILGDDDVMYPTLLERTVGELDRHPRAGVAHAAFDLIDETGEVLLRNVNWTYGLEHDCVEGAGEFLRESMRWSCRICASTALMRTAALPPERMLQEDFPAIDFGLWLRTAAAGWDFAFLNDALGAYRIHGLAQSAAVDTPLGPGYIQGIETVSRLKAIKLRVLAENDGRLSDVEGLRRLAEEGRRRELVVMARNLTLPERKPGPTLRALAQAVRADPAVVLGAPPWKLAAGSILGPRAVEWLKQRSGEGRRPRPGA